VYPVVGLLLAWYADQNKIYGPDGQQDIQPSLQFQHYTHPMTHMTHFVSKLCETSCPSPLTSWPYTATHTCHVKSTPNSNFLWHSNLKLLAKAAYWREAIAYDDLDLDLLIFRYMVLCTNIIAKYEGHAISRSQVKLHFLRVTLSTGNFLWLELQTSAVYQINNLK